MTRKTTFSYTVEKGRDWDRVLLRGPITEEARPQLQKIAGDSGKKCILDMHEVTFANSVGIRDWSYALRSLKDAKTQLVFERVPEEIIRTMNMIISFRQGLPVRSVTRIYECSKCDHEMTVLLVEGKDYQRNKIPQLQPHKCAVCGSDAAPLESNEEFFSFVLDVA